MRLCLNSIIHEVLFIGELLLSLRVLLLSSSRAGAFLQAIRCFPEREIISKLVKPENVYVKCPRCGKLCNKGCDRKPCGRNEVKHG